MSLGETIKKHRLDKGLSQKKLGDMCDPSIDASNIRRIENGDVSPTTDTLFRIANALNVPITDFFILDKEAYIKKVVDDPDAFKYQNLYSNLFEYVCEQNGFIVTDGQILGWGDFFKLYDDSGEFDISHDDVSSAFDRLIQHLSIELPAFLDSNKIDNGK